MTNRIAHKDVYDATDIAAILRGLNAVTPGNFGQWQQQHDDLWEKTTSGYPQDSVTLRGLDENDATIVLARDGGEWKRVR